MQMGASSAAPAPGRADGTADDATALDLRPLSGPAGAPRVRVVYVAMKPQLRGRIRRNVATLLELGADVTVLTVRTEKDFHVGLHSDHLRTEYFEARSLYVRVSQAASQRSKRQADLRRTRAQARRDGTAPARHWLLAPLYLLGAVLMGVLRLLLALLRLVGAVLAFAGQPLVAASGWVWRRLPLQVRQRGWTLARRAVRTRRRLRLRWTRHVQPRVVALVDQARQPLLRLVPVRLRLRSGSPSPRPPRRRIPVHPRWSRRRVLFARAVLRRRRIVGRALLNRRLAVSRRLVGWVKDGLRPWHRVGRFFAFWGETARRGTVLGPDLVVSSDLPGLVGAGRIARRLGIPHLHDCHELYLESTSFRTTERRVLTPMERHYLRRADSVVAVNQSIASEYGSRYGREPVVVRNCAPRLTAQLEVDDLRVLAGLPPTAQVVLYQGGFSVGRGLDVCVAAMVDLPEDVHLVLLGYGPLVAELEHQATALGVADRVHVLDAVAPEDLARCTVSATVGLMPYQPVSRNNFLALPNKIFEYTAAGVPIVVSDLPELRRIALGAGCGAVYEPFDATSLAAALRRVLDPARYAEHRRAAQEFGAANVWENEREILVDELVRVFPRIRGGADVHHPLVQIPD